MKTKEILETTKNIQILNLINKIKETNSDYDDLKNEEIMVNILNRHLTLLEENHVIKEKLSLLNDNIQLMKNLLTII